MIMRRVVVIIAAVSVVFATSVAAVAMVGTPEIDQANVTMKLSPSRKFVPVRCAGEDGVPYVTYRGAWKGSETEVAPLGLTDYVLSGPLSVPKVEWTINLKTLRGVLTGPVTLGSGDRVVYSGPLTLLTQGLPGSDAAVQARGWLNAPTYTNAAVDGGSILANVELRISGSFAANGGFGDTAPLFNTPSYAVATANLTC